MATLTRAQEATKSTVTCGTFLGTFILGVACVSCDRILQLPTIASNYNFSAAVDTLTHGLVGVLSWAIVIEAVPPRSCRQLGETLLCGLLSSTLDVDHFIAAGSIYLRDTLVLHHRPPLHSTTLVIFITLFLLLAVHIAASQRLKWLPYMFLTSSLSHQIRDASRRGLWFWPLGSTPPLPYWMYVALICVLPTTVRLIMERSTEPSPLKHSSGGSEQSLV